MKARIALAAATALVFGFATADETRERTFGLSGSVFDTPDPIVPSASAGEPGENEKLGSYFEGTPPMISHRIEDFLPITLGENLCLDCHDLPDDVGAEIGADEPTPIPMSHYTDLRRKPGAVQQKPVGARYVCTQCHAAQTDAAPLVVNTYGK